MEKIIYIYIMLFFSISHGAESGFDTRKPCSVYQLAAESLFAALPPEMISQQKMASTLLAAQFKEIDLKRVANHGCIEDLANVYDATKAVVLLMQIVNLQTMQSHALVPHQAASH